MKQNSKVIVVLVVIVVAFVATTLEGFRGSVNRGSQRERYRDDGQLPRWLTKVDNWLPSPLPSVDLSDTQVSGGAREGDVVLVGTTPVVIVVPRSDEDFRRADLRLESGPPVSVHVTDEGVDANPPKEAPKLESDGAAGKREQEMRVIISGQGGTIRLTREAQDSSVSRVRFE